MDNASKKQFSFQSPAPNKQSASKLLINENLTELDHTLKLKRSRNSFWLSVDVKLPRDHDFHDRKAIGSMNPASIETEGSSNHLLWRVPEK